ncbi:KTSC domain-containing protein [Novosphingobium sp.]|uniref:KTSC domain-containing protein n=1 Tax=Novosphingobium sp. TaxID=1874826 RepID=UPI00286DB056|nr:KTSC domain-containing protein [Novosphingobium sp.]
MPKFKSEAIKRGEYDAETLRLTLWFPDRHTEIFEDVPQKIWDGLQSSRSKGGFFKLKIMGQFTQVPQPPPPPPAPVKPANKKPAKRARY